MRLVVVLVLLGGCRPSSAPGPSSAPDLATPALRCAGMQGCVGACPAASLDGCVRACVARLDGEARARYDALEACVAPACAGDHGPCRAPGSLACKLCVVQHCPAAASACLAK